MTKSPLNAHRKTVRSGRTGWRDEDVLVVFAIPPQAMPPGSGQVRPHLRDRPDQRAGSQDGRRFCREQQTVKKVQ
jgi:hypothetical protein